MRRMFKRLLAHIPTRLPQGMTEFESWANDIIETYQMPNNDSIKFALAVSVLHLKATDAYVPKAYFGRILLKGAASQIAGAVMQECKARQEAAAKAEAEAAAQQPVEATTLQAVASNDPA